MRPLCRPTRSVIYAPGPLGAQHPQQRVTYDVVQVPDDYVPQEGESFIDDHDSDG